MTNDEHDEDDVPITALQDAIRHMHGCESRFIESVEVREEHQGNVVWEGAVKVFDLVGHARAARAYAWSYPTTGSRRRFVAVLGLPPVDSPVMAVRATILADAQPMR